MRKISTPYLHFPRTEKKTTTVHPQMLPDDETINKILQFAAAYRAEKVPENHFIDYFLN